VVVVLAFVELVDGLATFKVAAQQNAGLLELRQHPVHGGQANVGAVFQQHAEHILCRHVPLRALLKDFKNLQPRQRSFEPGALELINVGHGKSPSCAAVPAAGDRAAWVSNPVATIN